MKISIYKKRALAPIISAILLLVVGVILVTIVLSFGKNFTTKSLDSATDFGKLTASDASLFVFSKIFKDGVVMFSYSPPSYLMDTEITITHYRIVDIPEMTSVELTTPVTLTASTNIVPLECLYEYSKSTADITIQFITTENKYIEVKTRDPSLVCTSGGTGTAEDPIIVCDAEDLNAIRLDLDANYSLGKDIDLQCFSRQDINGWEPIGTGVSAFSGSLDGQNHKISNLYINRPTADYVGLFGVINASINNLKLQDINVIGSDLYTGGLLGRSILGTSLLSQISINGYVSGTGYVGSIAGAFDGNLSNSWSNATISGGASTGGLLGSTTDESYNTFIDNCYYAGVLSGTTDGGLIETDETGGIFLVTSSYWDTQISGQSASDGGTGKTTAEMKTQSTFTGWDFSSIWGMDSSTNSGYPYLRSNPPD